MNFEKLNLKKFKKAELNGFQASKIHGGDNTTFVVSFDRETGEPCDSSTPQDPRDSSRVKLG